MNVINVIDCVDETRSIEKQSLGYERLVFIKEQIPEATLIFRIPQQLKNHLYVTDTYVKLLTQHHINGVDYVEIWDSELTVEMEAEAAKKYSHIIESINKSSGTKFSYDQARKLVQQGKAMASGEWKIQLDKQGRFCLGQLNREAQYLWMHPAFIPPILLNFQWVEVEKIEL